MGNAKDRLAIGVPDSRVGTLGRAAEPDQSTFSYLPDAAAQDAVSLTMPVRLDSYRWENGIAPIKRSLHPG
jgi:serine/threonine-protein kinase HipA